MEENNIERRYKHRLFLVLSAAGLVGFQTANTSDLNEITKRGIYMFGRYDNLSNIPSWFTSINSACVLLFFDTSQILIETEAVCRIATRWANGNITMPWRNVTV